ncbi:RidA family protein [bacterium]|nr:RidA family protein [bacterium]
MHAIDSTLAKMGITLPIPTPPAANYVPYVVHGGQVIISGQLPMKDGQLAFTGKVKGDEDIEQAQQAARYCAIGVLAQLKAALGGEWAKLDRCLRLGIFVSAPAGFEKAHLVANGASNLIAEVLGDIGKHARSTICVTELPLGALVEVEGLFAVKA